MKYFPNPYFFINVSMCVHGCVFWVLYNGVCLLMCVWTLAWVFLCGSYGLDIKYFPLSLFILCFGSGSVTIAPSLAGDPPASTSPGLALKHTLSFPTFYLGPGIPNPSSDLAINHWVISLTPANGGLYLCMHLSKSSDILCRTVLSLGRTWYVSGNFGLS